MTKKSSPTGSGHSKIMHYGMMVCCAVMLLPIAGYFVAGGAIGGLWGKSAVFLPLVLCVGAHFVMHKMMGKSCHGASEDEETTKAIPLLTDQQMEKPQRQGV